MTNPNDIVEAQDNGARTAAPTSLGERQATRRNEVLAAAADAFLTRGYAAASIDDIADRLGCTKGRVYHYFRTKGEILVGIHRQALESVLAAVEPFVESTGPAADRLYGMALSHA